MPRRTRSKASKSRCVLRTDKQAREAADRLAASVQGGFPVGVSKPALRALAAAGWTDVDQLANQKEADLLGLHGVGPKAIRLIREELQKRGLSFAP